ncbi:hypothetical protein AB0878_07055 [Amycolatopsis sp. NPDC047767]|uniref:hypothetical protein n=1 Tax=Amycolatopsis sp. NPDC047767 TaxID=3156765 RepID=UPI003451291C
MGFFDMIGDSAKWVGDRFSDAGHWASDVWHGNVGTQSVPAPELVQKILASGGASSWHDGGGKATQLATDHHNLSSDIQRLSTGLESVWTGNGADAAQARIKMFSDATTSAAQTYTTNSQNLTGLAHGFDEMKKALQPMPGTPPHKDFIDVATPWDTDTEDKINQYNQLAQQNLQRYNGYAQQAQTSGQGLKADYGQLNPFDDNVAVTQPTKVVRKKITQTGKTKTGGDDKTSTSQSEVDTRHVTPPNVPPPTTPPPVTPPPNIPPRIAPPPTGRPITPPEQKPPRDIDPPGRTKDDDDTHTSSDLDDQRVTPPGQRFPVGSGNPSWSATGGGDGFGPGGFGVGAGAGIGGAGGSGAFGGRGSAGAGTGSRLGAGSGAFGEEGALAGRGAAAGAAGAKGSPGMGGMGAAGSKGKGEEDAEHQRKYGIDDDSAFSLLDDEDGRLLDPHTGLPPTPPTIGA